MIYANFIADHYRYDAYWFLLALAALLFGCSIVYFKLWKTHRRMPLLVDLMLVSLFIWITENIGTYTKTWLYPSQHHGWSLVSLTKLGPRLLLLTIRYTLVRLINPPACDGGKVECEGVLRRTGI